MATRSVTVGAADLIFDDGEQFSFDPDIARIQRRESLERAYDSLKEKYGSSIIKRGLVMTDEALCTVDLKNTPGIMPGWMKMG